MMRVFTVFIGSATISGMMAMTVTAQTTSSTLTPKSATTTHTESRTLAPRSSLTSQDGGGSTTSKSTSQARGTGSVTAGKPAPPIPGLGQPKIGARSGTSGRIPPPPAVVYTRSRSSRSGAAKKDAMSQMFVADRTGRRDLIGKPVEFYPHTRGLPLPQGKVRSALKNHGKGSLRSNGMQVGKGSR
jgi:hypothetical protein